MHRGLLATASLLVLGFGAVALSQPSDSVDTFSTRCFRKAANGERSEFDCTIEVWRPASISATFSNTDKQLREYVDVTVDGRLKKLDEKLVAVTVASNLRSTIVADLTTALPNDSAFTVQVVKTLTEKAKTDPVLRDALKSLISEVSQSPKPTGRGQ